MKAVAVCASAMLTFLVLSVAPSPVVDASDGEPPCDPYPIGRCGAYQRESVVFCFVIENGLYASATDGDALGVIAGAQNLGEETGVNQIDNALVYVRPGPTERFLGDPNTAPFPFETFFQESNNVVGLQPEPFECGKWTWFAECIPQQWMGPTGVVSKSPDSLLV